MKIITNNSMERVKKIVMYYGLGMAFSFWISSIVRNTIVIGFYTLKKTEL
jgi:hypothetical protein